MRWRIHTPQSALLGFGFLAAMAAALVLMALGATVRLANGSLEINGWSLVFVALPFGLACVSAQRVSMERGPESVEEFRRYEAILRCHKLILSLPAVPIVVVGWASLTRQTQAIRIYVAAGLVAYFVFAAAFGAYYAWLCRTLLTRLHSAPPT